MLPQNDIPVGGNGLVGNNQTKESDLTPNGHNSTATTASNLNTDQLLDILQKEIPSDDPLLNDASLLIDPTNVAASQINSPTTLYAIPSVNTTDHSRQMQPTELNNTPIVVTPGSLISAANGSRAASISSMPSAIPANISNSNQLASYSHHNTLSKYNNSSNYAANGTVPTSQLYYDAASSIGKIETLPSDEPTIKPTFKRPKPKKITNQASGPPKRPQFVSKLWNMVNDPANTDYISWLTTGDAFQVTDREGFLKQVLPKYFKHNNFASFVRQLNMYGWHKKQDVNSGSLLQDELLQFVNPNFLRDREDLLDKIVRNKSSKEDEEEVDLNAVMNELETLRKNQKLIAEDLRRVRQDNEMLWKENFIARERHKNQSDTLDKILRFLATVYGSSSSKFLENVGDPNDVFDLVTQRYANDPSMGGSIQQPQQPQQNTQPVDYYEYPYDHVPQHSNRQPLMIANQAHYRSTSSMNSLNTPNSASNNGQIDHSSNSISNDNPNASPIQEIRRGPENRNYNQFDNYSQQLKQLQQQQQQQQQQLAQYQQSPQVQSIGMNSPRSYFAELRTPTYEPPTTPTTELLMGNINDHLSRQQGTIRQVNDWITRMQKNDDPHSSGTSSSDSPNNGLVLNPASILQTPTPVVDDFQVDDFLNANGQSPEISSVHHTRASSSHIQALEDLNNLSNINTAGSHKRVASDDFSNDQRGTKKVKR